MKLGAAIGACVGVALIGFLILLPRGRQNSFYEVGDALLVVGLPLLMIGTAVGAMVGVAVSQSRRDASAQSMRRSTVLLVVVGLIVCVLAVWWFLWGTGLLKTLR